MGVQARVAGELSVLGERVGHASLRSRVTYATEAASVYGDLSVAQNLRYFARIQGLDRAAATRALERVGLTDEAMRLVRSLSGGQQGRVSLAIALLGDPELIVLDEPTVGLDPVLRAELWGLFRKLARAGATLLVSSHVMDEALRCDRLLLMCEGRILADTTPRELLESAARVLRQLSHDHRSVALLLASAFARTEFQAVQFMPLIVFPQILLGGLLMPRDSKPDVLQTISDWTLSNLR